MMDEPPLFRCMVFALVLSLLWPRQAGADPGAIPLYHYGVGDGNLGRPTAFAESWLRPSWVPARVLRHWPGIALREYPPGTVVRITVVGVPEWGKGWLDDELKGKSTLAIVADRPGGAYADAWWSTFGRLAPHWVGKLWVEIESGSLMLWDGIQSISHNKRKGEID